MRSSALFVYFILFAVATAFTIYDKISEKGRNESLNLAENKDCKCLNGRCVYRGEKQRCHCNPRHSLTDEETCQPCDCGKLGKCIFVLTLESASAVTYTKKCVCNRGSAVKDGICVDCNCGENSECEFDGDEKSCYCLEGYAVKDGVCKECNCGDNGECTFVSGLKRCSCFEGYVLNNGICEECDCGEHGFCDFTDGVKTCKCSDGYKENDGFCEECKCGENSYECEYENGEMKCLCNEGYVQKDGVCAVDMCLEKCGKALGVICYGERTEEVTCGCEDVNKAFVNNHEGCRDCNCGENSYGCSFMGDEGKVCKCEEGFVQKKETCEVGCGVHRSCKNGGVCREGYCDCLSNTHGEFCEFFPPCDPSCSEDADCIYEIQGGLPDCVCHDEERGFNPRTKTCARKCHEDSMCKNGGLCSGFQKFNLCECLRGTSGDICEEVDECVTNKDKCKDGAACVYDIAYRKAVCRCSSPEERYDEQTERCKRTCGEGNDCYNGGKCDGMFCYCLPGTSGHHCEKVDECEMNTEKCKDDAECVYDISEEKASCRCHDEGRRYDTQSERCRETCDATSHDCKNEGECDYNNFCKCLAGTSGDFCEKIDECPKCADDAYCVFDAKERRAKCMCKEYGKSYDSMTDRCRETCDGTGRNCENEGECDYNNFCKCLPGTSGEFCEKIDECPKCADDAYCVFDAKERKAKCMCKEHWKSYDSMVDRCREKCISDTMCENGGKCHERLCECLKGTSGDFCKDVDVDLCKDACGIQSDVKCLYDVERQIAKCDCVSSSNIFDPVTKTCRTCDCGRNAINCTFRDGKKICHCSDNFAERNGTCEKKGCTEKSCFGGKCEIVKGQEVCKCFEGYVLDGDYCRKLNCTKTPCINGTCVVRHGNIEECICPAGFTLDRDVCRRGSCRMTTCYGGRCETIDGELICVCPKGFHLEGIGCYETVCKIQRCFGGKCVVKDKQEICTCKEGYILRNDVCKKILCEKKSCFGGQCHIVDGQEVCTCPDGFSIFEDVCRANRSH